MLISRVKKKKNPWSTKDIIQPAEDLSKIISKRYDESISINF